MNKLLLLVGVVFSCGWSFAQQTYYQMPNGKIIDLAMYNKVKQNLSQHGKVKESIISKVTRNDSLIITPKLDVEEINEDGKTFNPYAAVKKLIGQHFPIEAFTDPEGKPFDKNALVGKPTLINFWFIACVPCREEMPILNEVKKEVGDKANFLAITFDDRAKVDNFLKTKAFDFTQIPNSMKGINQIRLTAFPANVIVDKNGTVVYVTGQITQKERILEQLKLLH